MSKKKQYKNRLPTVLPPAPRRAPEMESLPPTPPAPAPPPPEASEPEPPREPPAPVGPAPEEPAPRSRSLLVGLVLLGPLVVAGVLLATYLGSRGETGTGARDPVPGPTSAQEPLGAVEVADESYVEARVQSDGDIVVRQWIRAREPLEQIVLSLPEVPNTVLSATQVQVLAADVRSAGPRTITAGAATYTFAESTEIQLRYRLSGAVLRSDSAAGRALAVATTLDVSYSPRPERETRIVRAPAVLSVACTSSVSLSPAPCGTSLSPDEWRVDLRGARVFDLVIAQVTLDDRLITDAADAS